MNNSLEFEDIIEIPEDELHPQKIIQDHQQVDPKKILVVENVGLNGFCADNLFREGMYLDNEHCVLLVARLARFHAASYTMRKEANIKMIKEYPALIREHQNIIESGHRASLR